MTPETPNMFIFPTEKIDKKDIGTSYFSSKKTKG